MNAILSFRKGLVERAFSHVWQPLWIILSAMKMQMITLLLGGLMSHIFFSASFSQEKSVFLSGYDSCHVRAPRQTTFAIEAISVDPPLVRVAYVIPSNRTEQPNGVAYLQNAIKIGQQWYKEQMEQNGFGAKTYVFETEADGATPLVHVVHVSETDDYLREDIWGRTIQAASNAGVTVWGSAEVWVLIPEAHLMLPDGTVIGGTALGANSGTGNDPGVAMVGSNALPFLQPALLTDDTPYDGKVLPALGPFPMKPGLTAPLFEGNTFSSVASSQLGALLHEMGHAFGLPHDYRNDTNFHGNLMFNGLRGIRGSLFSEKYPQDYTRLAYASALILNGGHYFNRNQSVTSLPDITYAGPQSVIPQQGLVHIAFQASDDDSLSFAHLRYSGDAVAEIVLEGTEADTAFAVPYFTQGAANAYTIAVYDKQGNTRYRAVEFHVPVGNNQAPVPYIKLDPPVPGQNQSITLDASASHDVDHHPSLVVAEWDVDNDGQFDTEPSAIKTVLHLYENPGNYLIRVKLTDPAGAETISTPVSIKIPGEPGHPVASGFILREHWSEVEGSRVSQIPVHSTPSGTQQIDILEGPTNEGTHYGARIRGYVHVPASGAYIFWIASNDHSELWLSTDARPENKIKIASVSGATTPRQWNKYNSQKSAPVALVAGNRYYIEALHKQGVGSDNLAVGWQLPDGTLERPVPGTRLSPFTRDGDIPVATITNPENSATFTAPATINIEVDATSSDSDIMKVEFFQSGEKIGEDLTHPYGFTWSDVPEGMYSLTAKATNESGVTGTSSTVEVNVMGGCTASGTITREYWEGVQGGAVADIPLYREADETNGLSIFEGPTNIGIHYGTRISGFICPPATGNYYFYIASNDHSELWLSTGDDPANRYMIAFIRGATGVRQWNKYSSQRSLRIALEEGKRYYIEALHKQGVGSDHIAVAWQLPDGTMEAPIPGSRLSPVGDAEMLSQAATFTMNQEAYEQIDIYPNPVQSGAAALTVSGYEGIEEPIETSVEIINMMGDVVFRENIHCGGGCSAYLIKVDNKQLVSGVYFVRMKAGNVRLMRRLLVK